MIRPFKNIEELQTKTAIFVGDVLSIRVKQDIFPKELYLHKWLVTELNFSNKTVGLGTHLYPLEDLCKNFEFQKDNKWLPFGVEETKKPAKFKVGKEYFFCDKTGSKVHVFINAKYRDPIDHKIKVIANYTTFGKVHTDEKGDEIAKLYDGKIVNAENEVKE